MKKFLLFISLLSIAVGCSQPEIEIFGSISGLVKNSQTSELLSGVRVTLSPGGTSQITAEDGAFSFEELKSGEYSLTFSKDGFEDESSKISVKTGVSANVQITMAPIQPKLSVSTNALSFGEDATTLSLDISNSGKGILEWEVANNVDWIECSPTSGAVSTKTNTVVVSAKRESLDQGNYSGSFVISSNGGSATILVSISINGITLQVEPAELDFGTITNSLQIKLTNTASGTLAYEATSSNDWLTLNKTSGNITTNDYITAVVSRQGLSAGKYDGSITFATKKGALAVPVKMEIAVNEKPSVTVEGATNLKYNSATLQGTIVSAGSSKITKYGFCWSESATPTISDYYSNLGDCSEPKAFEAAASSLKSETKYYYRAYAENSVGISYSEKTLSFTTLGMPSKPGVSTGEVNDITNSSAKVKGTITSLGNVEKITQYGHVWSTKQGPTIENASCTRLGEATATCSFVSTLEKLETAQTYYVRAYATNEKGTTYGEETSFITAKSDPRLQTAEVVDITHNSAVCGGTITFTGGHDFTEVGVCYGKSSMPTASGTKVKGELKDGAFSCKITDLAKETKYYARAYVKTDDGKLFYGEDKAFQTTKEMKLPEVTKVTVTDISIEAATFESKITSNGNGTITECGFCWSDVTTPTVLDSKIDCDPSSTYLGKTIKNLKEGTKYYVCAYAKNAMGYAYSEAVEFSTIAVTQAELSNITVSDITTSSAALSGTINSDGNSDITSCGFVWGESPYPTTADNVENCKIGSSSLYVKLSKLSDGTTYYARSFAINGKGTAYSDQKKFTTLSVTEPVLTGLNISNITTDGAYITCTLSGDGNGKVSECGVCVSDSNIPTTADMKFKSSYVPSLGASFSIKLEKLRDGSKYYVRGYAINEKGTGYCDVSSFETISIVKPEISNLTVTNIGRSTAEASAIIVKDGNSTITEYGFCWSTSPSPTVYDNKSYASLSSSTITAMIKDLPALSDIYIRAFATNIKGTGYSETVSVKTSKHDNNTWDGSVASSFAGGIGTAENPILIETAAQLKLLANNVNSGTYTYAGVSFKLVSNLNMNNINWEPIGINYKVFKGNFDGDGCKITNLLVESTHQYNEGGLFGSAESLLCNIVVYGKIDVDGHYAGTGGICGELFGQCNNSINYCSVSGNSYMGVGGIVGQLNGTITNCANYGNVSGKYSGDVKVGGIVGKGYNVNGSSTQNIVNCSNFGIIKGSTYSYLGGIIGGPSSRDIAVIENCVNVGNFDGGKYRGGIMGYGTPKSINSCYWLYDASNNAGCQYPNGGDAKLTYSETYSFVPIGNACYISPDYTKDLLERLNSWVSSHQSTTSKYVRWEYTNIGKNSIPTPVINY